MAIDVGYLSAVGAGALSFLSPCVLPLVPPYLCYMAGVSVDEFRGDAKQETGGTRAALLSASLAFVLGFSTVFVALGAAYDQGILTEARVRGNETLEGLRELYLMFEPPGNHP